MQISFMTYLYWWINFMVQKNPLLTNIIAFYIPFRYCLVFIFSYLVFFSCVSKTIEFQFRICVLFFLYDSNGLLFFLQNMIGALYQLDISYYKKSLIYINCIYCDTRIIFIVLIPTHLNQKYLKKNFNEIWYDIKLYD